MQILTPKSELLNNISSTKKAEFKESDVIGNKISVAEFGLTMSSPVTTQTILVSDKLEPSDVISALISSGCRHLVQKNNDFFELHLIRASDLVHNAKNFIDGKQCLLLNKVINKYEFSYSDKSQKAEMKSYLLGQIQDLASQNVLESSEAVIEELYMNSILDAPIEAKKNGSDFSKYQNGESARMSILVGEKDLLIRCEDPFGSIDVERFLNRMNDVYSKGAGEVINLKGTGGAGLGCVIMFEHSSSMSVIVKPGKKTLVSCVIPLGMSYRKRAQIKKSPHLLVIK